MNKQQLAAKIWQSANKMRSKIEANEYKDYILGFIFYKFLSDKLEKYALEKDLEKSNFADELTESNVELVNYIKRNLGYFISYEHLFSTWLAQGSDFNIANVRTAMSAFSRNIAENYISVFENPRIRFEQIGRYRRQPNQCGERPFRTDCRYSDGRQTRL